MKKIGYSLALLVLALITLNCSNLNKEPLVIGHRGAMGYETENSLASIQKALDLGVDAIEIDVFRIQSGEIVVFHDEKVNRLTNGAGFIEELNIIQVKSLILDGGHRIPNLQDVLKLIDGKCKLNVELKGANTASQVNHILNYYIENNGWKKEDFIISSFNWKELKVFYELNKEIPIGILTEEEPLSAIPIGKELNAIAIHPDFSTLTKEKVSKIHKEGFKIYTWTVNNKEDIKKMIDFGVDGIITNYPDRVK